MSPNFTYKLYMLKVIFICLITAFTVESRVVEIRAYKLNDFDDLSNTDRLRVILRALRLIPRRRTVNVDHFLREGDVVITPDVEVRDDMPAIVEHELQESLAKKSSAALERPFVQHKGKNDFLVLTPSVQDPFVTVVPNDIYYNVEKRCVNWLDDCNKRGIRERLLQRVKAPFR